LNLDSDICFFSFKSYCIRPFCCVRLFPALAPEVLRRRHTVKGDGRYGKEIDCWSIGVILFILLSGSPPFDVSAGFDAVASARVIFHEDQWNDVSREARDLVKRLLEKDPRRRMSVRDACRHAWILVEDGDTHCHPLHDPLIARDKSMMVLADTKVNISEEGHRDRPKATEIDEKGVVATASADPSSTSSQYIRPPIGSDASVVNLDPRQMRHEESEPSNVSNDERQHSFWLSLANDKTATKAIQQACHTSQTSPNGSPIQKRQLFDEASPAAVNIDSTCKRMSKRDMESIMAAGKSLPPPVINEESLLVKKVDMPKKKVQSTLFPPTDASEEQTKTASLPKKVNHGDNRKAGTSTVTPPSTEQSNCGLVFRLNKKQKVGGKYISPEVTQNATSSELVVKKAELSEDELQSDFSDKDDEDHVAASRNLEKNPLEKYLHKRKTESIDSTPSVEIGSKKRIMQHSTEDNYLARPVSTSTEDDNIKPAETSLNVTEVKFKTKEKKQTCLFGKSPPNNELSVDVAAIFPACHDGQNIGCDPSQSNRTRPEEGTAELRCPSAGVPKGKQRSITSWLVK
jgi:serine/threonine protein kinase